MPKYRPGNLNLAQFWLRLPLEMKELNQLLNHNLGKMGKKKREGKKNKKIRILCDAVAGIRKSGISVFTAISLTHFHISSLEEGSSSHLCEGVTSASPRPWHPTDTLDGKPVGQNHPGTSILPKTTRRSRSEVVQVPSFAQNVILLYSLVGQRNCFQPFRAHRIFCH